MPTGAAFANATFAPIHFAFIVIAVILFKWCYYLTVCNHFYFLLHWDPFNIGITRSFLDPYSVRMRKNTDQKNPEHSVQKQVLKDVLESSRISLVKITVRSYFCLLRLIKSMTNFSKEAEGSINFKLFYKNYSQQHVSSNVNNFKYFCRKKRIKRDKSQSKELSIFALRYQTRNNFNPNHMKNIFEANKSFTFSRR